MNATKPEIAILSLMFADLQANRSQLFSAKHGVSVLFLLVILNSLYFTYIVSVDGRVILMQFRLPFRLSKMTF
jgi:hypothetical protein